MSANLISDDAARRYNAAADFAKRYDPILRNAGAASPFSDQPGQSRGLTLHSIESHHVQVWVYTKARRDNRYGVILKLKRRWYPEDIEFSIGGNDFSFPSDSAAATIQATLELFFPTRRV